MKKVKRRSKPTRPLGKARARLGRRRNPSSQGHAKRSRSMLELMLCSLLTIVPDYLYRRYVQGRRLGKEITFYSVWFELRWGITGCLILTICLITTIFYNHPSTMAATLFFRPVPILPQTNGRVAEIYIKTADSITAGAPIFRLDNSAQEAAVETARRKIMEVE